jgi:DNA segregation ATPase FtsK/SpoIIIE, S-DNA-T family
MAARSTKKSKEPTKDRTREIAGIILVCVAVALFLALASYHVDDWPNPSRTQEDTSNNLMGGFGAFIVYHLMMAIGYSSYFLAAFMIALGIIVFLHRPLKALIKPLVLCGLLGLFLPLLVSLVMDIGSTVTIPDADTNFGGALGALLTSVLTASIGRPGAIILSIAVSLVALVLTTDIKPSTIVERLLAGGTAFRDRLTEAAAARAEKRKKNTTGKPRTQSKAGRKPEISGVEAEEPIEESPFLTPLEDTELTENLLEDTPSEPEIMTPQRPEEFTAAEERAFAQAEAALAGGDDEIDDTSYEEEDFEDAVGEYVIPGLELLDEVPDIEHPESREEMLENARRLVESLRHFNIEAEVRQITPGPIVTRYELTLAPGIKVGRVTNLSDDLALTLKARGGIRIIAPIPGKAAIGIEVPNSQRTTVYYREIAESEPYRSSEQLLTLALGKSTSGEPVVADLSRMPHMLIAGSTGSGKSVCVNTLLASILMKAPPDLVRMILVDPKVVELSIYNPIPHLLTPVITNPDRASDALKWAVREMDTRYRQLAALGVRDINQYNGRVEEMADEAADDDTTEIPKSLPFIVIVIDEYADLMAMASNDIEESIARLAQMARAVGIHLVLATQRPSADVITGLIKANFPSRIAFKVMQASNSRIILDQGGADKLLGMGDMLFLQAGKPEPVRLHGAYISNGESTRLVKHVSAQPRRGVERITDEMFRSEEIEDDNGLGLRDPDDRDALFYKAARLVVRTNQGSVSLLQRRLKIGYARAARLIDQLEIAAVVGPYDGSKAREVLVDELYIDELEAGEL